MKRLSAAYKGRFIRVYGEENTFSNINRHWGHEIYNHLGWDAIFTPSELKKARELYKKTWLSNNEKDTEKSAIFLIKLLDKYAPEGCNFKQCPDNNDNWGFYEK